MITKMIKWFKGWVKILVQGSYSEKILNMCQMKNIHLWNVNRKDFNSLEFSSNIKNYKKIRKYCRKNRYKIKITSKNGLPFKIYKYRHRYGLLFGILAIVFVIFILTTRIWSFSFTSDGKVNKGEVMELLESYGVNIGCKKSDIDVKMLSLDMLENYDEISMFNINFYGSHAEIVTKSRRKKPEFVPLEIPCHIIADKDGLIERITVKAGTATVSKNSTVIKGDMLVKGEISFKDESIKKVHAMAEIILKTWREERKVIPKYFYKKEYTQKESKKYTLLIGNRGFPLYFLEKTPFMCYDKRYKMNYLTLPKGVVLPFGLACENYVEYNKVKALYQPCEEKLLEEMREEFLKKNPQAVILKDSLVCEDLGDFYRLCYSAEALESVGKNIEYQ